MKSKNNIISVLDIGTTKIVCLVADISSYNEIKIIAIGSHEARGFKSGAITNLKEAENSVISAVIAAEESAEMAINKVIVGISSNNISSTIISSRINLVHHPITQKDIIKITNQSLENYNLPDQEIIHYFPIDYSIDGQDGIKNPISMYGSKLVSYLNIIGVSANSVLNLANCITRCRLDITDFVIAPYASAIACLTEEEKELGSVLIDIGGSITSFSVFVDGSLIYIDTIPLAGNHITSDISQGLLINLFDAERIKILHGNAVSTSFEDHQIIEVPYDDQEQHESIYIKSNELSAIVRPRMEEIFELIKESLDRNKFNKSITKRVILTGGGSKLNGIKELASHILTAQIRISSPKITSSFVSDPIGPEFSTAIGMIKLAIHNQNHPHKDLEEKNKSANFFKKIFSWF